jgi:predicted acyltransferase
MATQTLAAPAAATRLISLDVFRGLTMAAMVIVNSPGDWGSVYAPLLHAEWHGWTPTDLIFPFFLFIVGVSITLSRRMASWSSILRRAAIILVLGLLLNGFPRFDVATWRIPGVLQRIAMCYLAAAILYRMVNARAAVASAGGRRRGIVLVTIAFLLCVVYWAVMMLVPPPGGVAGNLTPEGNLGAHIDRAVMGGHLWKPRWDPEGLLSTVPAIATTVFGVVAGLWIESPAGGTRKAAALGGAGLLGIVLGYAWSPWFPINKALWTSSYVLFTAGAASLLLAACYWTIDVQGWRGWTKPFVILGSNAIALYVASGLLSDTLGVTGAGGAIYLNAFAPLAAPKTASLLYAVANLVVLFALLAWMYRRRIFLRV